VTPPGE